MKFIILFITVSSKKLSILFKMHEIEILRTILPEVRLGVRFRYLRDFKENLIAIFIKISIV